LAQSAVAVESAADCTRDHTAVVAANDSLGTASTLRAPGTRAVCTITADIAQAIFIARQDQHSRDRVATWLAQEFNITPKAVRDICAMRTWFKATGQLWSPGRVAAKGL